MNGYFTSLFYTGQVLSLPRVSRVRTNKSHEEISIFFFLEEEKSIWSCSLFVPFYLEIKEHMIHWFTSLRGSLGILSRRCKIIGSSAKKKRIQKLWQAIFSNYTCTSHKALEYFAVVDCLYYESWMFVTIFRLYSPSLDEELSINILIYRKMFKF